jgi:cytochrome c oxidase subunit IV
MTADTQHDPEQHGETFDEFAHEADPGYSHGFTDLQYVRVAVILAVITAMEIYISYADWVGGGFIPLLLFLMAIKFISVVLYFMHLRFDSKIFGWLFYSGLFLAVFVYLAALLTFHFFNN